MLLPVLPRPRAEEVDLLLRVPPEDDAPPFLATFVLVALLAEARPREELLFLAAPVFLDAALVAVDFLAAVLLKAVRDAELPLPEDEEVLLPPLEELLFEGAAFLDAPLLEDFVAVREDFPAPRAAEDFLAPREADLRVVLAFLDAPLFLAGRLVDLLAAELLLAVVFLAAVFLAEVFLAVDFFAVDFFAADFFAVPLEVDFEAALLELVLDVLDAVLELPRPVERRLEAALLRPEDLDADLDEDLPPALLEEVFLEAAFLVDFAIVNGF